ncbi:unnamed protein product [Adineta ricciae]|uniref:NmrA-like family domain-containing protein 1 n=1 Tax=Adineta ricciae TaxID=249248 RepID=A0A813UAC9_ADIRI|nr:unnamed protein product [Adineta ricciae]
MPNSALFHKIRALTYDLTSEKAQAVQHLDENIEIVLCDITKNDDVERASKDSWVVFALTDFRGQLDKREVTIHERIMMADAAALSEIPYYTFSAKEDATEISDGKLIILHCTQKAMIRDYITEKRPQLKSIFIEPDF